jgi:hypothetical protein
MGDRLLAEPLPNGIGCLDAALLSEVLAKPLPNGVGGFDAALLGEVDNS